MNPYRDAFAFPFRRENVGPLVLGVFVLTFLPAVLGAFPVGGGEITVGLDLLFTGYYAVFLQSLLHATLQGDDRLPAWPDLGSPYDLLEDLLTIVAPFVVSFLPLIALRVYESGLAALHSAGFLLGAAVPGGLAQGSPWRIGIEILLLFLGWLYLPMATLAWTFHGGWSILNPVAVARSAWSTGPSYLLVSGATGALVTAAWAVSLLPGSRISSFVSDLLVFYALIVAIRLVGAHYRLHRQRLGWERPTPEPA